MDDQQTVSDDRGETLLELIVAITILGVCIVAISTGVALAVQSSDIHRKQTTAGAYVRSYAEAIEGAAATSTWQGCSATASTYQSPSGFSLPANYTASVASVSYWTGAAFSGSCSSDKGAQQLLLQVASADGRASEQLALVVRKP